MLPFYDFIIEMLLIGKKFDKEIIFKYFNLYSKTFEYNKYQLTYALKGLKYSIKIEGEDFASKLKKVFMGDK